MRAACTRPTIAARAPGGARRASRALRAMAPDSKAPAAAEPHFEATPARGECLIADAKDAIEACAGLEGADKEACFLALGCDAAAVAAAHLVTTDSDEE